MAAHDFPSHSASHLITSAITGEFEVIMTIVGCLYLIILAAILLNLKCIQDLKTMR